MEWEPEAEARMKRVPFFVRPFARKRVEELVRAEGGTVVTADACSRARARFADEQVLSGRPEPAAAPSAPSLRQVEACAGPERDCPFALADPHGIARGVEDVLDRLGYDAFALEHFEGMILPHHRLKVAVCACPNGCTQPQIKDIGVMARSRPEHGPGECTRCGICVEACPDDAVSLGEDGPAIDRERCVDCGACWRGCPVDALVEGRSGYEMTVGGRLGRHPRLAESLGVVAGPGEAVQAVEALARAYMGDSRPNERFGEFADRVGTARLAGLIGTA